MESTAANKTSGIGFKDKIGYAFGDVASLLVFGLVNTFLQIFYTDTLGITPLVVMLIMIIARVWDAINDPIWGRVVDRAPAKPGNRYKRWLLYLTLPLSMSAVLMFLNVKGLFGWSMGACVAYACVSYILFGMLYTGTNIPYGSMSSVITSNDKARNALSVFRSVGSTLGGFGPMIVNFLCWDNTVVDGVKVSTLNPTKLMIGVIVMAVLSVGFYVASYYMSKERVVVDFKRPEGEEKKTEKGKTFLQSVYTPTFTPAP